MDLKDINAIIQTAVKQAFSHAELEAAENSVDYADAAFGDFASNISFKLAKQLAKPPADIAKQVAAAVKHADVESAQAAGPYVNLRMSDGYWIKHLQSIGSQYAASQRGRGQKVQVEFISANPTGPTTFGNARGGYIGDALSRVLSHLGYQTVREYYFNDGGTQVRKLVESVKASAGVAKASNVQYGGEYIEDLAEEFKGQLKTASDDEAAEFLTQAILKRYIEPAIHKMGIEFDQWFNERSLASSGQFQQTLDKLRAAGLLYEKDGALWLKSSSYDPSREDRVLVKSNGDPTYLANDLAYHMNIFRHRDYVWAIKVLGPDHVAQFPSLALTIKQLLPDKRLSMAMFQWVRLIKGGKEVKVSKRAGNIVTIEEVIDEVTPDVARFFFLMRSAETHIDFDLDLAKEESQKNPFYYVMYAYARANSILRQAEQRGLKPGQLAVINDGERQLAIQSSRLPQVLSAIESDFGVHRLTYYGLELSKLFHDYYETERIIDLDPELASQKLYLIQQLVALYEVLFLLLGIKTQKRMER